MELALICATAFVASILTFFSGFGLGTILAPVFAIFFPIDIAIALTGVVHFSNNMFKIALVGKHIDKAVFLRFGIPAFMASFGGAWLLIKLSQLPHLATYELFGNTFEITPVKLAVAVVLIIFAVSEILPSTGKIHFDRNKLPLGGLLSGFLGGLTGLQGAVRSAFLIRSGLTKEGYIATGVAIACMVDISRLSVYAARFTSSGLNENIALVLAATLSAIAGAVLGKRMLEKVTFRSVQVIVAIMLVLLSVALGMGWI